MDIAAVDYWANVRASYLHRVSALAKLCAAGFLIAGVAISRDPFVLLAIYLAVAGAVVATGLPTLGILKLSAYPVIFAVLYAASAWDGTLYFPALIVLKTLAAAISVVAVIATTPYPQSFAVLRRLLPGVIADALFLTYRSLFILMSLLNTLLTAMRLRGGLSRHDYIQNVRGVAAGLGPLIIRGISLSERFWEVLRIRGYAGRLQTGDEWSRVASRDLIVLLPALCLFGASLTIRVHPQVSQYNGYLLLIAILVLIGTVSYRQLLRGV